MESKDDRLKQVHRFISKHYRYAVVGASSNPEKYGNVVFNDFFRAGFHVYPVNPNEQSIEGQRAYPTLEAIAPPVDVAVVVVPPTVGLTILDRAKSANVTKLWFQPGAQSEEIRKRAQQLGLDIQANGSCIMVTRRTLGVY